jgi:hypothetical protein
VSAARSLSPAEREALLAEVISYLPAFLRRDATEQEDPAGDVRELLDLADEDRERVVAVHICLDPDVRAFGAALERGIAHPLAGARPQAVVGQSVRGPVDWASTGRLRAMAPGERASFVVREPRAAHDAPENRSLAWILQRLESLLDAATHWPVDEPSDGEELKWSEKIDLLRSQVAAARRAPWLAAVRPEPPTASTLARLRRVRSSFYARFLRAAIESVLRLSEPTPTVLTEVLSRRYFVPERDSLLFELAVALRLARAFGEVSPRKRRTRLLVGAGKSTYARYSFDDGSEVRLAYQSWPDADQTVRQRLGARHGLTVGRGFPDLFIVRKAEDGDDAAILELKASLNVDTLRGGLSELLAYLGDRPDLFAVTPAGWLIAPAGAPVTAADSDASFPLWIVSADEVAAAAVARFAPAGRGAAAGPA